MSVWSESSFHFAVGLPGGCRHEMARVAVTPLPTTDGKQKHWKVSQRAHAGGNERGRCVGHHDSMNAIASKAAHQWIPLRYINDAHLRHAKNSASAKPAASK